MQPWNDSLLQPPPVNTSITSAKINVQPIIHILEDILSSLKSQIPLKTEEAILSRLIYKYDKKFRNDIGFKFLKKVHVALRRYEKIDLLKHIETFQSVMPLDVDDMYLPTKQMLQYILLKVQSFAMLMKRIVVCSKKSVWFYFDRIKRGDSLWMSFIPFSILSRIWSIAYVLLRNSCNWYNDLVAYLSIFQPNGIAFIPDDYKFPNDLKIWIELESVDQIKFDWAKKKSEKLLFALENEDDVDEFKLCDYISGLDEHTSAESIDEKQENARNTIAQLHSVNTQSGSKPDLGETISREMFHKQTKTLQHTFEEKTKKVKVHRIESVIDSATLEAFVTKEEQLRNRNSKKGLTLHLSFMQWQSLKVLTEQLIECDYKAQKLAKKFRKVWKKRCLDYM